MGWRSRKYDCCKFHKKNALTGGSAFCVSTSFHETKSTDLESKTMSKMEKRLFLKPIIFGVAKSTDTMARGFGTDTLTGILLKKLFSKTIFYTVNPSKKSQDKTLKP